MKAVPTEVRPGLDLAVPSSRKVVCIRSVLMSATVALTFELCPCGTLGSLSTNSRAGTVFRVFSATNPPIRIPATTRRATLRNVDITNLVAFNNVLPLYINSVPHSARVPQYGGYLQDIPLDLAATNWRIATGSMTRIYVRSSTLLVTVRHQPP